ncbi:replication initiator protein A [Halobacillus litoralis]|uniref:Replication initiator A N-terminal domain-containing protein n=1 Tax=Halobacillus litoralis TaxID=45668 RepID=A0A410MAQ9_9BACI|nr:replication initiator protein A [Halobacillus litoralis]QAS51832.1 hypothetical protein HLI_06075 [Halobacillus litoralis]
MINQKGKFMKVPKEFFQYEELRQLSGDHIFYYSWLLDLKELSKKNADKYTDSNGRVFVIFTEKDALDYCNIKKSKLYRIKLKLKDLGLIDYDKQKVKKSGISTPIYVKELDLWDSQRKKSKMLDLEMPDFNGGVSNEI